MRFLLDTHLLLWALNNPERLANATRDAIEDSDNDVLFSTASIWEIANKARLRRTDFAVRAEKIATEAIATEALAWGFGELLIRWQSASIVADLPPHHRDPFDRIFWLRQSRSQSISTQWIESSYLTPLWLYWPDQPGSELNKWSLAWLPNRLTSSPT